MTHFVPPPEPPPIVQVISTEPVGYLAPKPSPRIQTPKSVADLPPLGSAALLGPTLKIGVGQPSHPLPGSVLGVSNSTKPSQLDQTLSRGFPQELQPPALPLETVPTPTDPVNKAGEVTEAQAETDHPWLVALEKPLAILPAIAASSPKPFPSLGRSVTQTLTGLIAQATKDPATEAAPDLSSDLRHLELQADRLEYSEGRRVVTAKGNVSMTFQGTVLLAENLEVDIPEELAVATGNVTLTRGEQLLQGDRFEYNFVAKTGTIDQARGEVFLPSSRSDFSPHTPVVMNRPAPLEDLGQNLFNAQPQDVIRGGGIGVSVGRRIHNRLAQQAGVGPEFARTGNVNRLRFSAERISFTADGWQAYAVEVTNDPFSPPELKLTAREARLLRLKKTERRAVEAKHPRLVFDNRFSLPLLRSRVVIDRRQRDSGLPQIGFDGDERGGVFLERSFNLVAAERVRWQVTPQYFVQRSILNDDSGIGRANAYGLVNDLAVQFSPHTLLEGRSELTSFDFGELDGELRANLSLRQRIGDNNTLAFESSFRDRQFNGSLGFQTIQSSFGGTFVGEPVVLGNSGLNLGYQAGIERIRAKTDQDLPPGQEEGFIALTRYQGGLTLSRSFGLWKGKALEATSDKGLRYSPVPIVPFLSLSTSIQGMLTGYSNGDAQNLLSGTVSLQGQLGHFAKSFLDYTAFRIGYSQAIWGEESPFLFDRFEDTRVLFGGITQQLIGPFQAGFQVAVNLDTDEQVNTSYVLQYSRRTYSVSIRYDSTLKLGGVSLQINGFNWTRGHSSLGGATFP